MLKLIASDLDGTLLQNGAQKLGSAVFDQIRALKERGILFVAASGRQYLNLRRLFAPVADDIAYIAENGSLCICQDETLSKGLIDRELGHRIIDAIHSYHHCDCIVSGERLCYTDSKNDLFIDHLMHVLGNDVEVTDNLYDIPEDYLKIAVCDFKGAKDCLVHFQGLFSQDIKVVTSGNVWVDFIAPNANKGTALKTLLEHLSIDSGDCMAFGDQYNDIEMLQLAGTSYAMSNAAPGISYYSTYVTDSVEDVLEDLLAVPEF